MTEKEFGAIMAYISTAIGKPLGETEEEADRRLEVYFDLLGDLEYQQFKMAAKKVCLEHKWATFPSAAELREAAAIVARGRVVDMPPAEAWELAWKAVARIDLEIDGSVDRACADLPPAVFQAMKAFGLPSLCYGKEPVSIVRAQFLKVYEQLLQRDQKAALLPPALKKQIEDQSTPPIAGSVASLAGKIGRMEGETS